MTPRHVGSHGGLTSHGVDPSLGRPTTGADQPQFGSEYGSPAPDVGDDGIRIRPELRHRPKYLGDPSVSDQSARRLR